MIINTVTRPLEPTGSRFIVNKGIFVAHSFGKESSYVKNVKALSDQGYIVFIGSHKKVQDLLIDYKDEVIIVYPAIGMRHSWIRKLSERYDKTHFESDKRALERCVECFSFDIARMSTLPFKKIELRQSEGYNLYELLKDYIEE